MKDDTSQPKLIKAIQNIYSASESDVSCNGAAVLMANFIDNQGRADDLEKLSPKLYQHVKVCVDCEAELQMNMMMAQIADSNESIKVPARPDKKTLLTPIREALDALFEFPGFAGANAEVVRGVGMNVTPVEIQLNDTFMVEIDVGLHANDNALRDLFLSVTTDDDEALADLEGVSVWLTKAGEDHYAATAGLDEYGEAILAAVEPNVSYFLQIMIPTQVSRIQHLKLP